MATLGDLPRGIGKGTYLGIDPSLTSTGIAVLTSGRIETFRIKPGKRRGTRRLCWLDGELKELIDQVVKPDVTCVEGYSYGSGNQAHQMGEWGGLVRLRLLRSGRLHFIVAPGTLKKFATGKGNSSKPAVAIGLFKRWGVERDQEDEVDAAIMAIMAVMKSRNYPLDTLPDFQVEALGVLGLARD